MVTSKAGEYEAKSFGSKPDVRRFPTPRLCRCYWSLMDSSWAAEHFRDYFDVSRPRSAETLESVYRVRYDVYCREFGFEREEDCPGGLERDDFDAASAHCLIVHRESGIAAGCIRVVLPPADDPDFLLPLERFCGDSLHDSPLHPSRRPRGEIGEVSRLAVHTQFRRRPGESVSPVGTLAVDELPKAERRTFPLLGLSLFCAGASLMRRAGREHAYVMMERSLARRLISSGFPFSQIGEPIDYHGLRAAYHVTVQQVLASMPDPVRGLFDFVDQGLD